MLLFFYLLIFTWPFAKFAYVIIDAIVKLAPVRFFHMLASSSCLLYELSESFMKETAEWNVDKNAPSSETQKYAFFFLYFLIYELEVLKTVFLKMIT